MHLLIALIAGAFIVLMSVTGSILAFEPEIDRLLHPHLSRVTPRGKTLSLVEIGDRVSKAYGAEPIVAYLPSQSPIEPTQVIVSRGIVVLDPYTGEVLGLRTRGETFIGLVRALHTRLAAGDTGREFVKWSAVVFILSLVSGFWLWWPIKQFRLRAPWRSRTFFFDLHNAVGILALLPLLVLAATGTAIGFEDGVSRHA